MPRITIHNVDPLLREITIQDPAGLAGSSSLSVFSANIPAGTTKSYDVSTALAEGLMPQLDSLVALGRVTYAVSSSPGSSVETGMNALPVFATSIARDAAITSPINGQKAIVNGAEQHYSGGAWRNFEGALT